ncbi:hypothetical protein F4778DRAFT_787458 [Xylariomycetidae sp. FL2044]|nr:hypothetical protein F4778DRAFT_787458 [Xylariomycetidae sp. FL2044]
MSDPRGSHVHEVAPSSNPAPRKSADEILSNSSGSDSSRYQQALNNFQGFLHLPPELQNMIVREASRMPEFCILNCSCDTEANHQDCSAIPLCTNYEKVNSMILVDRAINLFVELQSNMAADEAYTRLSQVIEVVRDLLSDFRDSEFSRNETIHTFLRKLKKLVNTFAEYFRSINKHNMPLFEVRIPGNTTICLRPRPTIDLFVLNGYVTRQLFQESHQENQPDQVNPSIYTIPADVMITLGDLMNGMANLNLIRPRSKAERGNWDDYYYLDEPAGDTRSTHIISLLGSIAKWRSNLRRLAILVNSDPYDKLDSGLQPRDLSKVSIKKEANGVYLVPPGQDLEDPELEHTLCVIAKIFDNVKIEQKERNRKWERDQERNFPNRFNQWRQYMGGRGELSQDPRRRLLVEPKDDVYAMSTLVENEVPAGGTVQREWVDVEIEFVHFKAELLASMAVTEDMEGIEKD